MAEMSNGGKVSLLRSRISCLSPLNQRQQILIHHTRHDPQEGFLSLGAASDSTFNGPAYSDEPGAAYTDDPSFDATSGQPYRDDAANSDVDEEGVSVRVASI